jgi:hypothetical protein
VRKHRRWRASRGAAATRVILVSDTACRDRDLSQVSGDDRSDLFRDLLD